MVATCQDMLFKATARPNCSLGTRFGIKAELAGLVKARATPSTTRMMKMGQARMDYDAAVSFYQKALNMIQLATRAPGHG